MKDADDSEPEIDGQWCNKMLQMVRESVGEGRELADSQPQLHLQAAGHLHRLPTASGPEPVS